MQKECDNPKKLTQSFKLPIMKNRNQKKSQIQRKNPVLLVFKITQILPFVVAKIKKNVSEKKRNEESVRSAKKSKTDSSQNHVEALFIYNLEYH